MKSEHCRNTPLMLCSQKDMIERCINILETVRDWESVERILTVNFGAAPDDVIPDSDEYYAVLNYHLYRYILKHYRHKEDRICFWRFIKNLSPDQLDYKNTADPELRMSDWLVRIYFYSDPLDDLTCMFIPVSDTALTADYLDWIKSYFYDANYPTSLLWLYALDSALASLFPDEIIYLGTDTEHESMIPDFEYKDSVLIKKFSGNPGDYMKLEGKEANNEFRLIFNFLQREFKDRCLSRSGKQEESDPAVYKKEWEKFEDVLKFGVSDKSESGCISFSDMRSSTEFLSTYGKNIYLNKIQQPFFEKTKFIRKKYKGRIDKFMGDNVMSVFLNDSMPAMTWKEKEKQAVMNNFLALLELCRTLFQLISDGGLEKSKLGLRSGVTYGNQLLRSNLGNDILRDFTVTGETVNLAARLEHISIQELIIHNQLYFKKSVERFSEISKLISISECCNNLNPETRSIIEEFTLYQNILSNLEKLETVKFDIRANQRFYFMLRENFREKGYEVLNSEFSDMYGYEEYNAAGFVLRFYFSFYNPKGFSNYEKIWILPIESDMLEHNNFENLM